MKTLQINQSPVLKVKLFDSLTWNPLLASCVTFHCLICVKVLCPGCSLLQKSRSEQYIKMQHDTLKWTQITFVIVRRLRVDLFIEVSVHGLINAHSAIIQNALHSGVSAFNFCYLLCELNEDSR